MRAWTATAAVHEGPSYDPKAERVLIDPRGLVVLAETTVGRADATQPPLSQRVVDHFAVHAQGVDRIESPTHLEAFVRALLEGGPWRALATANRSGGNAAVIALAIANGMWSLASVGDARAYRVRDQSVELVVRDHTLFTQRLDAGELAETDFFSFAHHTVVNELLGMNEVITVRTSSGRIVAGESLVLCTHHLWQGPGPIETRQRLLAIRNELDADTVLRALHENGREGAAVVVNFL